MSQGTLKRVNFFVIGAAKCGTTTLHARLNRHPEVFLSPWKSPITTAELTWTPAGFPRPSRPTPSWTTPTTWRCQTRCLSARWGSCATSRNTRGCSGRRTHRVVGECSTSYLWCQARRNPCAVTTRTPASWSVARPGGTHLLALLDGPQIRLRQGVGCGRRPHGHEALRPVLGRSELFLSQFLRGPACPLEGGVSSRTNHGAAIHRPPEGRHLVDGSRSGWGSRPWTCWRGGRQNANTAGCLGLKASTAS